MQEMRGNNYQMAIERINRLKEKGKWRCPPISLDALYEVDEDSTLLHEDKRVISSSNTGNSIEELELSDCSSPRVSPRKSSISPRMSHSEPSRQSASVSQRESSYSKSLSDLSNKSLNDLSNKSLNELSNKSLSDCTSKSPSDSSSKSPGDSSSKSPSDSSNKSQSDSSSKSPSDSSGKSLSDSLSKSPKDFSRDSEIDTSSHSSSTKTKVKLQQNTDIKAVTNESTWSFTRSPNQEGKITEEKRQTTKHIRGKDEIIKILSAKLLSPEMQPLKCHRDSVNPKIPQIKTRLVTAPSRQTIKIPSTRGRPLSEAGDRLLKRRSLHSGSGTKKADKKTRRVKRKLLSRAKGDKTFKAKSAVPLKDIIKDMEAESAVEGQGVGGGDSCTPRSNSDSDSDKELLRMSAYARWMKEQQMQGTNCHKTYRSQLAVLRSRLISNVHSRDKLGLREAIADAEKENIAVDTLEYAEAIRTVSVLSLRDEMLDSIDKRDIEGIKHTISAIERRGFKRDLCVEVAHARASIKLLQRTSLRRLNTGVIDIPTMAEISRYREPPPIVHRVVMAALLLMGVRETITKKWKRCQKVGVMMGSGGMNRRVHQLTIADIHPMIAARARQILENFIPEDAIAVSPGVGALYKWVRRVVGEVLVDNEDPDNPVEPASDREQRQIFSSRSCRKRKTRREKIKSASQHY